MIMDQNPRVVTFCWHLCNVFIMRKKSTTLGAFKGKKKGKRKDSGRISLIERTNKPSKIQRKIVADVSLPSHFEGILSSSSFTDKQALIAGMKSRKEMTNECREGLMFF